MTHSPEQLREMFTYDPETGFLYDKGGRKRKRRNGRGYIVVGVEGKHYLVHRVAWAIVYGQWPANEIDHINGDVADNRLCNLRAATRAENARNRKVNKNSSTGITGVTFYKARNKWKAKVGKGGAQVYLGWFTSLEEAIRARRAAEMEYYGDFIRTNRD